MTIDAYDPSRPSACVWPGAICRAKGSYPSQIRASQHICVSAPRPCPPLEPDAGSYVQADTGGYQILLDYQGLTPHLWWLPLLPPIVAWGLCATVITAYRVHQERQKVLPS